jgi:hypothetical protein
MSAAQPASWTRLEWLRTRWTTAYGGPTRSPDGRSEDGSSYAQRHVRCRTHDRFCRQSMPRHERHRMDERGDRGEARATAATRPTVAVLARGTTGLPARRVRIAVFLDGDRCIRGPGRRCVPCLSDRHHSRGPQRHAPIETQGHDQDVSQQKRERTHGNARRCPPSDSTVQKRLSTASGVGKPIRRRSRRERTHEGGPCLRAPTTSRRGSVRPRQSPPVRCCSLAFIRSSVTRRVVRRFRMPGIG